MKDLINKRHSIRNYKQGVVLQSDIDEVLALARRAPSAGGLRSYEAIVATGEKVKELAQAARQLWIGAASLVVVLCALPEKSAGRYGDRGRNLYCIQDTTLFGSYLDLLLVEKGYGTCWVGAFNEGKVEEVLSIPEGLRPISFLVVGIK
jgi:nitroreductase